MYLGYVRNLGTHLSKFVNWKLCKGYNASSSQLVTCIVRKVEKCTYPWG